jgi:hypothetical protein
MLDKLTIDDFQNRLGETFQVTPTLGGEAFELELRRADPSPFAEEEGKEGQQERERDPFSIEFHSRTPDHVPQQIFEVEHEKLGKFDLFLVPLGPDAEGHRYEAVFG